MVAVTSRVALPPAAIEAMVHGTAVQAPVTRVTVRFSAVPVTRTPVAGEGPALATTTW